MVLVAKCKDCGAIIAGTAIDDRNYLSYKAREWLNKGFIVEWLDRDSIRLKDCSHIKEKREMIEKKLKELKLW